MIRFKYSSVVIHIIAWLLFLSFPLLFLNQDSSQNYTDAMFPLNFAQFAIVYALVFYLHSEYLFPKLYFRKKYLAYIISSILLLLLVITIKPFDKLIAGTKQQNSQPGPPPMERIGNRPPPPRAERSHFDINSIIIFIMVMGIGAAFRSIKELQLAEKRTILAEAGKANAELSFLKAQINPHFLYNTLNNIYTLCITGSDQAAESIMKLSSIMRYVTDEAEANFVSLQGEIDCITNFIDLQKLRLGKKVILNYEVTGNAAGHQISPLILMTFIENVFKYGLSNHVESKIYISVDIKPDQILFYSQNKIFENKHHDERSGLGLKNTKQRLEHLYPDRHTLTIDDTNGLFTVNLILNS